MRVNRRWLVASVLIVGAIDAFVLLRRPVQILLLRRDAADVAYGQASPAQKLDLYLPAAAPRPWPLVVYMHGGGFRFGDKRDTDAGFTDGVRQLNAAGLAVASINYRLSGEARFPAAVQDARSAVRWLRANAARYGIAPGLIAVWGKSAGANLAMMVGVTDQVHEFDDPAIAPGVSSRVSAVVSMYGATDFPSAGAQRRENGCEESWTLRGDPNELRALYLGAPIAAAPKQAAAASPISYVRRDLPPMLLQAGTADCVVPSRQAVAMHEAMRAAGSESRLMLLSGAKHSDVAFETNENHQVIVDFIKAAPRALSGAVASKINGSMR